MLYREIGKTGMKASIIGMGVEGLIGKSAEEVKAFFDLMEERGINMLDIYSSNPEVRTNIGLAIKGRREKFILQAHLCSIWQNGQYKRTRNISEVKAGAEELFARLGTDYIDIGMIHYVDAVSDWENIAGGEVLAYAEELKRAGRIKTIGLSSHNPEAAIRAVKSGKIDVLMFSVNPCYDLQPGDEDVEELWNKEKYKDKLVNMDEKRAELYELCAKTGVAITVMKAFGGGDLLNAKLSLAKVALTPYQCIRYALERPGVVSIMCGARSVAELAESADYVNARPEETDYAEVFMRMPKISWEGHCMYCGHCAPCPVGINVAEVTKFLNLAAIHEEIPETVREHYKVLEHHASECISCGGCESRCPFKVGAMENMKKAAALFGY